MRFGVVSDSADNGRRRSGEFVKTDKLSLLYGLSLCLIAFAPASPATQQGAVKRIGCFGNVRSDGEHADGYSVRLWLRGNNIIGLIDYHRGLAGDPPMGILTDVGYESRTGTLAFNARLTTGLHSCPIHKMVPAHDRLSFRGTLKGDRLQGRILVEDQLDSVPVVVDRRANFLMRRETDCVLEDYENYDAWWRYWDPVYKLRGSKW
jgi:hypothetical protein